METLKQWAVTIIMTALSGAVIQILMPKGKTERMMNIVLSLFFLCAILSPFITGSSQALWDEFNNKILISDTEFSDEQESLNKTVLEETEKETENIIYKLAAQEGFSGINVEVNMDISGTNSISIDEIKISVPAAERNKAIEWISSIEKTFNVTVTLDLF